MHQPTHLSPARCAAAAFGALLWALTAGVALADGLPEAMRADPRLLLPEAGMKADHIIVDKAARRLSLYSDGALIARYQIALGGNPRGPKRREGDQRTPEGAYLITDRNSNSAYYRSLRISYPSLRDASRALAAGEHPGGQIMIHGIGPNRPDLRRIHGYIDWTDGCIAVTDREMDEIWALVDEGTLIDIRP